MISRTFNSIESAYMYVYNELLSSPKVGNTTEIENARFSVKNPTLIDISFPMRNISKAYSDAEMKWYWSADNSCKTIGEHAKLWLRISDDGETSNSAYGYILFKKYGFDQLQQIVELLKKDPESRRAVLNISDPSIDRINTKDMQCTIAIQFLIRNNELHETVYMRSNDVYYGLPYDYIFFVSIGKYVASKLNIPFTLYTHNATSLHMYTKDFSKFVPHNQHITVNWQNFIADYYEVMK